MNHIINITADSSVGGTKKNVLRVDTSKRRSVLVDVT
jgi:hypothetical protein